MQNNIVRSYAHAHAHCTLHKYVHWYVSSMCIVHIISSTLHKRMDILYTLCAHTHVAWYVRNVFIRVSKSEQMCKSRLLSLARLKCIRIAVKYALCTYYSGLLLPGCFYFSYGNNIPEE